MTTRTIQIEDDLDDRIEGVVDELLLILFDEIKDDVDLYSTFADFIERLDYDGTLHEYVDSATPIYTSDIEGLFYLYSGELEQAYDDAGCYDEKPDNYQAVCIYFYIEQEVYSKLADLGADYDGWALLDEDEKTVENLKEMLGV
jgi:hypothetical protein